jgi:hypothetical protein
MRDLLLREHGSMADSFARRLAALPSGEMLVALDDELEISGAKEIVVYGQYERILGAASRSVPDSLPSRPPAELVPPPLLLSSQPRPLPPPRQRRWRWSSSSWTERSSP